MEFQKLEGPAFDAFLKIVDAVKKDAARVNNMNMEEAWGRNGALELIQLIPLDLGVATLTSTTRYGYSFGVAIGAADGLIQRTIPAGRALGIYGFTDGTVLPTASQLNISIGSRLSRSWPMIPAQNQINNTACRLDPIEVPESKQLTITDSCYFAGTLIIAFLGVYAQPKS